MVTMERGELVVECGGVALVNTLLALVVLKTGAVVFI